MKEEGKKSANNQKQKGGHMKKSNKTKERKIKRKNTFKSFSRMDPESWDINALSNKNHDTEDNGRIRELSDAGLYLDEEESSLYYNRYSAHLKDDIKFKINDFLS